MIGRPAAALALCSIASALTGCVTFPETLDLSQAPLPPSAVVVPPPPRHPEAEPASPPAPPKPSLSQLTDRTRPHLEFHGAKIYADSISSSEAKGNVFLDGRELHKANRSFPLAVYAGRIELDGKKEKVTLSDWPIVQTDSAYVQAQAQDTVIVLSRDRMAKIKGPARYVIGSREAELFAP